MGERYRKIEYQPFPVKDILKEMKNISEMMIDLAYYSAIYCDRTLVDEITRLRDHVDRLELQLMMQAAIAVRSASEAERMLSVLVLSHSFTKISGAAVEIAKIAKSKLTLNLPDHIMAMDKVVCRTRVMAGSWADGRNLGELYRKSDALLNVALIRSGGKWVVEPDIGYMLKEQDTMFAVGLRGNASKFREAVGDLERTQKSDKSSAIFEGLAEWLIQLMNLSESLVDVSYIALLASSNDLAKYVIDMEEYIDSTMPRFEQHVLSTTELSTVDRAALLNIAEESERISDAARDIAEITLFGLKPHPIISEVLGETKERLTVVVAEQGEDKKLIQDLDYEKYGGIVLAVKRKNQWNVRPAKTAFRIENGDLMAVEYLAEASELENFPRKLRVSGRSG